MRVRDRAATYREYGWKWEKRYRHPLVHMYASPRYWGKADRRFVPMLAYQCRRAGQPLGWM